MSHELLQDVLRTSDAGGRARRRSLLPLSIALHAGAIAVLLLVPLVADNEVMPGPVRDATRYVSAVPTPPAPPEPPPPKGDVSPATHALAPLTAANAIEPEKPVQPHSASDPGGVPSLGTPGSPSGVDFGGIGTPNAVVLPPAPPPREPVRIGGVIREPKKIVDVPPIYPPLAIAAQKEGVVIMEAMIDERGHVVRVRVLRSEPLLDAAAVSAVERWRYTPTLLNNQPVPVLMTVAVRFRLR
jgi:protein TonB